MVASIVKLYPASIAIDAWDGQLTYQQVEDFSNTIGQNMLTRGLLGGSVIAIYLEKTRWAPVMQLAGMKAGCVILMLSSMVPEHRIQKTFKNVGVQAAVVSESLRDVVSLQTRCLSIEELIVEPPDTAPFPVVTVNSPAAILVSSGSTGEPKQILWNHSTMAANVKGYADSTAMNASSRVFQFASYDFDVSTVEVLSTLAYGGCICIPSESDRLDELSAAISSFAANHMNLTPSTAKILEPKDVPSLTTMVLGGENLTSEDVSKWRHQCSIINWYGPAESSAATFHSANDPNWYTGMIGDCSSANDLTYGWIVDPKYPDRLSPFGAVGELALEGSTSSVRYIGNEALSKARFFENPGFLAAGFAPNAQGRHGRVYLTGDLVKYDSNGKLVFIGRQDTQLKIRGQIVSPLEVECEVRKALKSTDTEVVVDAVILRNRAGTTLAAFVVAATQSEVDSLTAGLNAKLKGVLPDYAIPYCYIAISSVPTSATGKRNYARLREIGASFEPLRDSLSDQWREPATMAERTLRGLWATALDLDADNISTNASFLRLGDSIQAMRLVGIARQQGLQLTVAEIFQNPVLVDMAKIMRSNMENEDCIEPFSLLGPVHGTASLVADAAELLHIKKEDIEDLLPCTPLQEGLLALTVKTSDRYIGRNILKLAQSIDPGLFRKAWEKVISMIPILRTSIIDLPEHGLVQAILRSQNSWVEAASYDEYLAKESERPMSLGAPLMRCCLFAVDGSWYFLLTLHHSIYDGWAVPLFMEFLEGFYHGIQPLSQIPFQSFVKYIRHKDRRADAEFWKGQFEDLEAPQFPAIPSSNYQPQTDSTHVHIVERISRRIDDITPSTVIRTAFAILCAQYTNSPDVVFGTVVDGRKAAVSGIERLAGPTIATVPIRVKVDDQGKILTHLHDVQRQTTDMIPHEQTGLSNIARFSEDAHQACQFQTMLVIQPQEKNIGDSSLFAPMRFDNTVENQARRYHKFNSYALSVICSLDDARIKIEFSFDSAVISKDSIQLLGQQFGKILKTLCNRELDDLRVGDIDTTTDKDLNMIWNWNSKKPESIERCYHQIFADVVQSSPDAVAATGWDGEVTYAQLDLASTTLAYRLIDLGVQKNTIIPLCFDKSVLTLVALLGVIKAGAGVVFLDMALPGSRLESIVQQFNPNLIVSSPENQPMAKTLVDNVLVINAQTDLMPTSSKLEHSRDALPFVDPSDYLYAVFTSGTTGTPKGCLIQHRNFSSAVTLQRDFLGFTNRARVYDFSSYSFDAVHWTILHTLAAGGTLCVPSDVERKSNLTESIRNFNVTHIGPTPSLARLINPDEIPTMERIYFGGESVTKGDLSRWMPQSTVTIMYGPSECSSTTVFWRVPKVVPDRLPIGYGVGASTWIVDPKSNDRLAPVGAIGELWLEGPLVGIGYLNNKERTEASYIEDPSWLLRGSPDGSVAGRAGRMYRTGDLVKYDPIDGALIFVSRKDTQVKLRGQRIELTEVEYHARNCLARRLAAAPKTTAEVVVPKITGRASLMVFVELKQSEHSKFYQCIEDLKDELTELVPSYMVPAAFIPVEKIPLVVSGKTDRRRLRELGESITLEQFGGVEDIPAAVMELTEPQLLLRTLWVSILGVSLDKIHSESSFLRLGGDSISAMRLAVLARSHNISLTVQNILRAPRLSQMSNLMENLHSGYEIENEEIKPFSLLKSRENKLKAVRYAAAQCNVKETDIMDLFPCTGVQKSLLSMTAKSSSSYIARPLLKLGKQVDLDRLQKAWEIASKSTAPIICYRVVNVPDEGLVQAHVNDKIQFAAYSSMETFLGQDTADLMGLGTRLTRFSFVNDTSGDICLVLTQHHAMYDGYSLNLLLNEVSDIYSGIAGDSPVAPFQAFVKHISSISKEESRQFWQSQFADSDTALFPELPGQGYQPKPDSTVEHDISDLDWPERDETPSTLIRAAWAILTARYTDTHDVVFGAMVTGRQAPLPGIDRMIAPLANAVPVRIKFDSEQSVSSLLHDIQQQSIDMIAFEQTELLDIRRIDANTERGTRFNTLLVVQPPFPHRYGQLGDSPFLHHFETISGNDDLDDFNPNAVMVMCQLSNAGGLQLEISFDSGIIGTSQMELIASQFEHVLRQICVANTETVQDISMASARDIQTLWKWNSPIPEAINECIPGLISKMVKEQPDAPAICAWDGMLSYSELNTLSDTLALHLVSLGAKPGTRVPLCFEKSMWYPVAALGAMKTGAACIAIDSTQPEARLRAIICQVDPIFVLSSSNNDSLVKQLSTATSVIVSQQYIDEYSLKLGEDCLPKISPSDTLYIVFTSGSTGTPKGVITSHRNFASAAIHQADILHIKRGTRVFDFVSYSFDVSWSNHLQTLICGVVFVSHQNGTGKTIL
uniref:Carrier domain-containing protein n=1 Tax=Bionectria ochroleuca TaxID=29856 RepID=A0A8H7N5A7_BIOOC